MPLKWLSCKSILLLAIGSFFGTLVIAFVLTGLFAQSPKSTGVGGDEHIVLCHTDWLRFYRVELSERDSKGQEHKAWSRWYLIDDRKPEDKREINDQLNFYRSNSIRLEFRAIEASLPE